MNESKRQALIRRAMSNVAHREHRATVNEVGGLKNPLVLAEYDNLLREWRNQQARDRRQATEKAGGGNENDEL